MLLLSLLFFTIALFSQSPYQLKTGREISLLGAGLGLSGTSYFLHKRLEPLSVAQIEALKREGISRFERWVTTQSSVQSHKASDVLLYSSQAFPIALTLLDKKMRKDAFPIATMYSQAFLLNSGVTALLKNTVARTRPYVYNPGLANSEKMNRSARNSFPSGHTSGSAAMCFLSARLYADYHPDSKWKPVVWSVAAVIPATTGLLRMTAGKHFPTDVLVGYVTGAAIGFFIPYIHQR